MTLLLVLLVLTLCVPRATAENGVEQSISYVEDYGKNFRITAECQETEHAVYLFEKAVGEEVRQACIAQTESLLAPLAMEQCPEICILSPVTFDSVCIEGNRLFTSPMDWGSMEYAALVLQAAAGEYSHYGLAYGLAGYLRGETGAYTQPENTAVCDLSLLCFDETFALMADVSVVKALACAFATQYIAENGEATYVKLLCASDTEQGMDAVAETLRLYYAQNGLNVQPAALRFSHGGSTYQYRVRNAYAEIWVSREWQDQNWQLNPLVSENFLQDSYEDVRDFFLTIEKQMACYQQLFALDEYDDSLTVILPNHLQGVTNSCYQGGAHRILLLNVDSLMHEYIHALTKPNNSAELWETEGLARYFSYYYDAYGIPMLNQDYNNTPDTAQALYVREYLERIGRPIDMAVDYGEIESIIAYTRNYQSPNENYASGAAFVHYLVQRYGETVVIRYVMADDAFDESLPELVEDWKRWLWEHYAGYTLYTKPQTGAPKLPPGKSGK